jgi:hypothetical protein
VDEVPDPAIEEPTDAIIRVTTSAICDSDLHLYEVLGPFLEEGDILGHEPMGIVELFRTTMRGLNLDDAYGAYVDAVPAVTLAVGNLMSFFGLHRRNLGALLGHLAAFEMTSSEPNRCYAAGLARLGADQRTRRFFAEHVQADAVHERAAEEADSGR